MVNRKSNNRKSNNRKKRSENIINRPSHPNDHRHAGPYAKYIKKNIHKLLEDGYSPQEAVSVLARNWRLAHGEGTKPITPKRNRYWNVSQAEKGIRTNSQNRDHSGYKRKTIKCTGKFASRDRRCGRVTPYAEFVKRNIHKLEREGYYPSEAMSKLGEEWRASHEEGKRPVSRKAYRYWNL